MSTDDTAKAPGAKLDRLLQEIAELATKVARLERENHQLRTQHEPSQPAPDHGDACPYCRRATGKLVELKPHRHIGIHGIVTKYYKCSNPVCGKTYDKQAWPNQRPETSRHREETSGERTPEPDGNPFQPSC